MFVIFANLMWITLTPDINIFESFRMNKMFSDNIVAAASWRYLALLEMCAEQINY